MKFASSVTLLLSTLSPGLIYAQQQQEQQRNLRSTTILHKQNTNNDAALTSSTCSKIHDSTDCAQSSDENGISCVWCECSAVPSVCMNMDQAQKMPPGVFDCNNSPDEEKKKEEHAFVTADAPTYHTSSTLYSLRSDEVDGSVCDPSSKSLSGYVDISGSKYDDNGEDKHLFYWFFEKRGMSSTKDAEDIPLILWLTGGPGCSSTLALLTENGPCSVTSDGKSTTINPNSWTEAAHVLWLDQPAGVGYSYGDINDSNEEMISEDAYYFLQKFYEEHPEYSKNKLFVVGESYGGHYAPAIAHKVYMKNKSLEEGLIEINLGGLAVGNGLTDPVEQYKWYAEMAFHNSHNIQTISEDTYNAMTSSISKCTTLIEECNKGDSIVNKFACQTAFVICNMSQTSPYQMTGLNPYDIRLKCGDNPLCYDFSNIETWLNLEETKEALHISKESHYWRSCNMGINLKFHTDWMKDFSPFVKDLLNGGIPALIYAGDVDFICNYMGNRAWTLGLDWSYGEEFRSAEEHEWEGAGLARTSNGLTFLQVYDAGHMVPSDQPVVALSMIQNFIEGGEF
jgi:cathepsin A (carboxypeptidase C)